jgi:hypothetical protein
MTAIKNSKKAPHIAITCIASSSGPEKWRQLDKKQEKEQSRLTNHTVHGVPQHKSPRHCPSTHPA